jgi:uncharacterized cupin superfamily protein
VRVTEINTTQAHYLANVATVELTANEAAPDDAMTAEKTLVRVAGAAVGVWEVRPGVLSGPTGDEAFVVLTGSATLTFPASGEAFLIGPGDIVKLEAGEVVNWEVHQTLRKVYAYGGD